jgi:ferredoxin-NADP reductase/DMSO/TMAO reductase YedYZ heme-binding membrane subunit
MIITKFTKRVVILNSAVPAVLLAWDAAHNDLGANPVNFAIRTTGLLTIIFLLLSLSVTPLVRLAGWSWLGTFRRSMGVSAFAYAAVHLGLFFFFDRAANIVDTISEIGMRTYLLVGIIGVLIMLPLAVTSTDGMIRRLGAKRWKLLHRLAYLAAIAGALHFYMLVKADTTRPLIVAGILGLLFGYRIVAHYRQLQRDSQQLRTAKPLALTKAKSWKGSLRVARIFLETPNVKTFRFVPVEGGPLPFDHEPGQYLILSLMIDGQPVRRSYTISSPPSRNHFVEITVKREENGLASRHLHDNLREGDVIAVTAPAGRFTFTGREAESIVMIAGGVGITPLMVKIRYLTDCGWPGRIHLVVSARTEGELIFRRELDELQRRHANLEVTTTLTREDSQSWSGMRGRITAALLRDVLTPYADCRIHLCGPTEMTEPLIVLLKAEGVAEGRIHQESFASPSRDASTTTASPFDPTTTTAATLEFARSGRQIQNLSGRTILELAEANGITIPYDCRAAVCGQCKTRVLAGNVLMDADDALDANDRVNGVVLACQARCQDAVVIDA